MTLALGVLATVAAAVLYSAGVTLQAVEARQMAGSDALRPALLGRLVRRRRWIAGTACVAGGWGMQALALMLAPISIVQPGLALSIVSLLYIGYRWFGEPARRREVVAAVAIVVGVGGLVAVSPRDAEADGAPLAVALCLAVLGLVALLPFALRGRGGRVGGLIAVSAGLAYAWTGFSTKFLADGMASGAWTLALIWLSATAVAAVVGLLSEMTALQTRSAVRVFPVVLVVQIVVAVLLAPLVAGESWSPNGLVVAGLGLSLAVVAVGTRVLAGATGVEAAIADDPA